MEQAKPFFKFIRGNTTESLEKVGSKATRSPVNLEQKGSIINIAKNTVPAPVIHRPLLQNPKISYKPKT